jgi:hypothetical protein
MEFNDLLAKKKFSTARVLVMRHRPTEPELRKVLPWLAADRPEIFNAYQQTQSEAAEKALAKADYLASFIGQEPGRATFVGLYKVGSKTPLTFREYWKIPAYREMKAWGHAGFSGKRQSILWFELTLQEFYSDWKGRLIVNWPRPERSWCRWAARNEFKVDSVLSESRFDRTMPEWDQLVLTWDELKIIPTSWRGRLREWRGIYYIYDIRQKKGYIGSAYGRDNLLGRWTSYASRGHGGNKLLRACSPSNLQFSTLQRVSPDLERESVFQLESSWKARLHTREAGLNLN